MATENNTVRVYTVLLSNSRDGWSLGSFKQAGKRSLRYLAVFINENDSLIAQF